MFSNNKNTNGKKYEVLLFQLIWITVWENGGMITRKSGHLSVCNFFVRQLCEDCIAISFSTVMMNHWISMLFFET